MRLGPGRHLKGLTLAEGCVKPEEFDYFHELIIQQEFARVGQRGYGDGMQVSHEPRIPSALTERNNLLMNTVWNGHWFATCTQLWIGRTQSTRCT